MPWHSLLQVALTQCMLSHTTLPSSNNLEGSHRLVHSSTHHHHTHTTSAVSSLSLHQLSLTFPPAPAPASYNLMPVQSSPSSRSHGYSSWGRGHLQHHWSTICGPLGMPYTGKGLIQYTQASLLPPASLLPVHQAPSPCSSAAHLPCNHQPHIGHMHHTWGSAYLLGCLQRHKTTACITRRPLHLGQHGIHGLQTAAQHTTSQHKLAIHTTPCLDACRSEHSQLT